MTVSSTSNRKTFAGDDATTSFGTSPVVFFDTSDLEVRVVDDTLGTETLLVENTDYTVSGGDGSTGTVDLSGGTSPHGALLTDATLVILRVLPLTQTVDLVNNDTTDAEVVEEVFDRLVMIDQQISEVGDRVLKLSEGETGTDANTTLPFDRASKFLAFDASKDMIASEGLGTPASAFMATVLDDVTAAAARATLDVPSTGEAILDALLSGIGDLIYSSAADTPARLANGVEMWMPTSGRLTLTTAVPVTTSDVTGATTVYFTPYKGNVVQLYDGATWIPFTFSELSQTTADDTKSPAAVAVSSNYDVFVWNDAGTLRATRGPAWTSDTARGTGAGTTELEVLEGRYVNKIAITNGPAAQRGLYVGTIRSDASSQINDSVLLRHVWNNYNRVAKEMFAADATGSWTYTTNTWRQANGSAANQLSMVVGLDEDPVSAAVAISAASSSGGVDTAAGIGLDSSTALASRCLSGYVRLPTSIASFTASFDGHVGVGLHTLRWLEISDSIGTTTWYGDAGVPLIMRNGIKGRIIA
jgi:hypothetical protein